VTPGGTQRLSLPLGNVPLIDVFVENIKELNMQALRTFARSNRE
jgi:hypothetical protein